MAWYDENRMVVEGERYWNERYMRDDEYDRVRHCDLYDCEDCPRYGDDCDGKEDEDDE